MTNIAERFALCRVPPGGILLELQTGALYELNGVATLIWERRLAGEAADVIGAAIARRFGLPPTTAALDVEAALAGTQRSMDSKVPGDFSYDRSNDSFAFSFRGTSVLEVDDRGQRLLSRHAHEISRDRMRHFVQAIAPKLLTLRGHIVVHAGAVCVNGDVVAVSGVSGAGKTTTARALVRAGAQPLSEDRLVLQIQPDRVDAVLEGERRIDDWADQVTTELIGTGEAALGSLDAAIEGSRQRLVEVGFIDAGRRVGTSIVARRLAPVEAAGSMFRSVFHGSDSSAYWRRQLEAASTIGRNTVAYVLTMPDGVLALEAAAGRIVTTGTFR